MKKKVLVTVFIIISIILVFFAYFVVKDLKEEEKIKEEIEQISKYISYDNIQFSKINKKLDNYISKKEYLIVERSCKKYLKDVLNILATLINIVEDENISKLLTADNYLADGPYFSKSKMYITTTKNSLKKYKDTLANYLLEDTIMSYIDDKNLDSYYVDFYKEIALSFAKIDTKDIEKINYTIDTMLELLTIQEEVLDFLILNKDFWIIQGKQIYFDNENLVTEYNNLLLKIGKLGVGSGLDLNNKENPSV